jgi:hypothetical protein
MILTDLVGFKILAVRGIRMDMRRKKGFYPQYILFDDGKTFIEIEDQDYYTYHDCDGSAKVMQIVQSKWQWKGMMNDQKRFPVADVGLGW